MTVLAIVYSVVLFGSAFTSGGVLTIYLRYPIPLLRNILLFLCSLFLTGLSFLLAEQDGSGSLWILSPAGKLAALLGGGLNMYILPRLCESATGRRFPGWFDAAYPFWIAAYTLSGLLTFLLPGIVISRYLVIIMLPVTIGGFILYLVLSYRRIASRWWAKAMKSFLIASGVFLVLLIGDMCISLYRIRSLAALDGLSLPVYITWLNAAVFIFNLKFVRRGKLVEGRKISAECVVFYHLTKREEEIVNLLLEGLSTREIADALFISSKTVENHLSNIYRKFDVGGRNQLTSLLNNWTGNELSGLHAD